MPATRTPDRAEAVALLEEFVRDDKLRIHAYCVEGVMRHLARLYGEDEETWGFVGLVHDLDYEQFPEMHCRKVREILEARNWPPELIRAVESHGWGLCSDVEPVTTMEKCLYTYDELTGLVYATALVRPSKSILDVKPKSVRKKWKVRAFAAGANREVIEKGAAMLGVELNELFENCIRGMQDVADAIGLAGAPSA